MEVKVGDKFKINNSKGEIVTVLYVPEQDNNLLLLRESVNVIRANGVYFEGGFIFWNNGDYQGNGVFKAVYDELGGV